MNYLKLKLIYIDMPSTKRPAFNHATFLSLGCALELSIPDIIHNHGKPIMIQQLVSELNIPVEKTLHLQRVMRLLTHSKFFSFTQLHAREDKDEKEGYVLTASSKLLLKNTSENLPNFLPFVNLSLDPVLLTPWQFCWLMLTGQAQVQDSCMPKYLRLNNMSAITSTSSPPKETSSMSLQIPTLTATNYTTWAIKMEAVMDAQGLWESIEPPSGVVGDEKKNKTARAFIFQAIPEDVLLQVAKKKTAKEIWDSLRTRYVGADRVQKARLHTLTSEFETLKMKDGESIDDLAGKLNGLASKHTSLGSTLDDGKLVRKLLDSVPDRYLQLVASMEQYSDVDEMPFEEAVGRLKAYEDRLKLRQGNTGGENGLLLTKSDSNTDHKPPGKTHSTGGLGRGWSGDRGGRNGGRGRGSNRGRGGRWGGSPHQEPKNTYRKPKDRKHIKCFKCDQFGHYASECETGKKPSDEIHLTQEEETSLLLTIGGDETTAMVLLNEEKVFPRQYDEENKRSRDTWYLDNGANNHMTGLKVMFA
ncbi:hypothetical protein L1987_59360 [Smallanthus sonchifolius]|uniref:Uncharacterized protein n=1 Tax=Smallanthus sonchifolius TaxID=185202 RepID=A0ACB9D5R8_9ASTR|nr:hypothetical protein L1987_59360 [Smallanthus sonchifolius]